MASTTEGPPAPAERDARWAEERLRLAIDAGRLGPREWDIAGGRVSWSTHLEAIHGVAPGSFEGTFEAWRRDIHPADVDRVLATVGEGLAQRTGHNMEYRIIRPDGAVRWLEVRSRIQCDERGEPIRMLGVCMDVTERRELEQARDLFIGILGHDLKNPLQAIVNAASIVQARAEAPALVRAATIVQDSAQRMDAIIRDLLDFARGRFGSGIPVTPQPAAMDALCRPVIAELQLAHPEAAIELSCDGELTGAWDPERVAQVASNLIGNAIVHGDGAVRVALRGEGDAVVLEVANGGAPIPPEALPLVFQPFYSSGGAAAQAKGNIGLGLFIASEIVRAHGGRIDVASSAADGTVFTVTWPRAAAPA